MKRLFFLVIFGWGFWGAAFAENYSGEWQGKKYDFYLEEAHGNVFGSYGNASLDFYLIESSANIYGRLLGGRLDVYVRPQSGNIYGELPCGRIDFYYQKAAKNLYGEFCGNHFDSRLATEEETVEAAKEMLLSAIEDGFPLPVKAPVRSFIQRRIKF